MQFDNLSIYVYSFQTQTNPLTYKIVIFEHIYMFIHCWFDRSEKIIQKFTFETTQDKLIINAHTKDAIYQGELLAGTTETTFEEYQTYLDQEEYSDLTVEFAIMKFISYDFPFTLINKDILVVNQLKQQKDQVQVEIRKLREQLDSKQSELRQFVKIITKLQAGLKQRFTQHNYKEEVDQREVINQDLSDLELQVLSYMKVTFPHLFKINVQNNKITDAGLRTLVQNASKFKSLKSIVFDQNEITDIGLRALSQNADKFSNLIGIGFNNNKITDEGLKILIENADKFKNLKWIRLQNNKITNPASKELIENAEKFASLERIWLEKDKVIDLNLKNVETDILEEDFQQIIEKNCQIYENYKEESMFLQSYFQSKKR